MLEKLRTNIACTPDDLYLIDCNICKCETSACGNILRLDDQICVCSEINYYIDRRCVRINHKIIQKIDINEITKITEVNPPGRKYYSGDIILNVKSLRII